MRAILLPSGNLLVPVKLDEPAEGFGMREIGPDHPQYGQWLPFAEDGDDCRSGGARPSD